jgi:GH24 family phage-related lysozyme (muramidase)
MKYNREDYAGAAEEFLKWRKANGVVLRGLERRREAERALFLSGG